MPSLADQLIADTLLPVESNPFDEFTRHLPSIESADQLKALIEELGLEEEWDGTYSTLAFGHLLEVETDTAALIEFVRNPTLGGRTTKAAMALVDHFAMHGLETTHSNSFIDTLQEIHARHSFTADQIQIIVSAVSSICHNSKFRSESNRNRHFDRLFWGLWDVFSQGSERESRSSLVFFYGSLRELSRRENLWFKDETLQLRNSKNLTAVVTAWAVALLRNASYSRTVSDPLLPPHIGGYGSVLVNMVKIFPPQLARAWTESITTSLAKRSDRSPDFQYLLLLWFDVLRKCDEVRPGNACLINMESHYRILSEHVDAVHAWKQFQLVGPRIASRLMMRFWIPRSLNRDAPAERRARLFAAAQDFHSRQMSNKGSQNELWHFTALILALDGQKTHMVNAVWKDVVEVIYVAYGLDSLIEFVRLCAKEGIRFRWASETLVQIFRKLSQEDPESAYKMFRFVHNLHLSHAPYLASNLIKARYTGDGEVFFLLNRSESHNSVPTHLRTEPRNALMPQRIELINSIAGSLAADPRRSNIEAYRSALRCFRYLRSRDVPVSPTLARALVHAGVSRPLASSEWVPLRRARFLVEVVEKCEGEDKAHRLEQRIWNGRAQLIKAASRKLKALEIESHEAVTVAKKLGLT
jgi:hypothetical protein